MFNYSNEGWFFTGLGVLSSVVLFIAGLKLGRRRGPQLSCYHEGLVVLDRPNSQEFAAVRVTYSNAPVERLCVCRAAFWNSGDATIEASALVDADPIQMRAGDGHVLDCDIEVDQQHGGRGISVTPQENNEACVRFDFLNPGEGFVVRILHTSKAPSLTFHGSLKGGSVRVVDKKTVANRFWDVQTVFVCCSLALLMLAQWAFGLEPSPRSIVVLLVIVVISGAVALIHSRFVHPLPFWLRAALPSRSAK